MSESAFQTVSSVDLGKATAILKKLGPGALAALSGGPLSFALTLVSTLSSAYTDACTRRSEAEKAATLKALQEGLTELTELVKAKDARVPVGAFNFASPFAQAFAGSAFIGASLAVTAGINALNRIGAAVESIRDELSVQNVGRVQGWGDGGFGHHVHRFIKLEMSRAPEQGLHFFFAWVPANTSWQARFEEQCQVEPLGPRFGGYHEDLDTICNIMWIARMILAETEPGGREAVFHLVVPAFETIAINDLVIFDASLHPLIVTGDLYRGHPLVWLSLQSGEDRQVVNNIGHLPDPNVEIEKTGEKVAAGFGLTMIVSWTACAVGATICPPLLTYLGMVFCTGWLGLISTGIGVEVATRSKSEPRTLGPPLFIVPDDIL